MGAFYDNIQVFSNDVAKTIGILKKHIKYRAYVSGSDNGCITIYNEFCEYQDNIIRFAKILSSDLSTIAFVFSVYHSDILYYWLFNNGELIDEFDSDPDYFTGAFGEVKNKTDKE